MLVFFYTSAASHLSVFTVFLTHLLLFSHSLHLKWQQHRAAG